MKWYQRKKLLIYPAILIVVLVYTLPRWIASYLGAQHYLASYLYTYGFAIPFFLLALLLLFRSGALNLKNPIQKRWFYIFFASFIWALASHGAWVFLAVKWPFKGS